MPIIDKFRYRSEIDGLRALAILTVVLYHAGFPVRGGYVGVDVFFVISGFIITSMIWKELESGTFSFAHFWERRARRILPALVVMTVVTLVAAWFLLLPTELRNLGKAVVAQVGLVANVYYWQDSNYFAIATDQKPLVHTWSLAVEEQFYLIIPVLLWGIYRLQSLRSRSAVITLLCAGFVLSLASSVYGVARFPEAAFYLLPNRAWELLLGSLVAFLPLANSADRRVLREIGALAGLGLILFAALKYHPRTPFPGLAALPPCLGAALIIWANGRSDEKMPTLVGRLLSLKPIVFIGLISYSLYLWHWPLFAFSKSVSLTSLSQSYRVLLVGLSFLLAVLSWKFVETPFRKRRAGASQKSMFAYSGAGLGVVLTLGLLCIASKGFPQRFSPQAQAFADAESDLSYRIEVKTKDVLDGKVIEIGAKDSKQRPSLFVWGDSHGMSAMAAFDAFLQKKGLAGQGATHSSTAPVLNWFVPGGYGLRENSPAYNEAIFDYIKQHRFSDVVLCGRWDAYIKEKNNAGNTEPFTSALLTTVKQLRAVGCRSWILLDVPYPPFYVPKALSSPIYSVSYIKSLCPRKKDLNELEVGDPQIMAKLKAAGCNILDPKPAFLDPTGKFYWVESNGAALYFDQQHLTTTGAKLMLLPLLRDNLKLNPLEKTQ